MAMLSYRMGAPQPALSLKCESTRNDFPDGILSYRSCVFANRSWITGDTDGMNRPVIVSGWPTVRAAEECLTNLREVIALILEHRREFTRRP